MSNYHFRSLEMADFRQMHRSFVEAFADYVIPMQLNYRRFTERMINKLNIRFDLSVGAFSGEKLAGFAFHTVNDYKGARTVYNGGTGVIPGHRGAGLTVAMYEWFRLEKRTDAEKCVLEVITSNEQAIRSYERAGFRRGSYYRCYKLAHRPVVKSAPGNELSLAVGSLDHSDHYRRFDTVESSFSDTFAQLRCTGSLELVLEAREGGILAGYLIFQPVSGRLSRLAVGQAHRRRGIATALVNRAFELSKAKILTAINVPEAATDMQALLLNLGFKNEIDQWEMELIL